MPFVEIVTRQPLQPEVKSLLARKLSETIQTIEIGCVTEKGLDVDWMWFRVLPEDDWAVGGQFSDAYIRGRTICFARIIAPEGFLNRELQLRALSEVTQVIREALGVGPDDDGSGIWAILDEVPKGTWSVNGKPMPLVDLIEHMGGEVSTQRREEMQAHFSGYDRMKDHFGIPR